MCVCVCVCVWGFVVVLGCFLINVVVCGLLVFCVDSFMCGFVARIFICLLLFFFIFFIQVVN